MQATAHKFEGLTRDERGFYVLQNEDTAFVPVRLFLTETLLNDVDDVVYGQIINATRFPGTKMVAIMPDVHIGYGVPIGSVILTDAHNGAIAMGPVGYDIGCGMISARSPVPASSATPERRLAFNRAVMERVEMGTGSRSRTLRELSKVDFERLVRGGAPAYNTMFGEAFDRSHCERDTLPVDDAWSIPWGGPGHPERGVKQIGSLGAGNHFMELQRCVQTETLFVQIHTGSRGFGHGLATNYFHLARAEKPREITHLDLGYFTPDSPHFAEYLNAVSAGANFAIVNRLVIFKSVAEAFEQVFSERLEVIYEISHNLVQRESHPEFGDVWVHRKGATRAFPAGHPALAGTRWEHTGHPILIPASNLDRSHILRALPGAVNSAYSVNHGSGRRLSRTYARKHLDRWEVDENYREQGIVINLGERAPIDESAPCYKPASEVIECVVRAGLAQVEYELVPLSSLKGRD
ncbi:MAG TPA: RtcB family protein [Candidatus Dormibacteraeota bacterium]|nr:RtcB family protein [Candidatus Dormibacteraeota bacterium]